jgi:succinoglycan biosynthesis protein ExoM
MTMATDITKDIIHHQGVHISVCICTFKRTKLLGHLLHKLAKQVTNGLFSYSVTVVDNDQACSAQGTVLSCRESSPTLSIKYCAEPEQNIALARNKALASAQGEFIAFIDDDELPVDDWLINLYYACCKYNADGALGPVLPQYQQVPPQWVIKGKFFERPSHKSGHVLESRNTRTGNLLIKRSIINDPRTWFRKEYGSGGEDRDFFKRMIENGHTFVWCNEAPVYEMVPPDRWKKSIMIKRALLRGKVTFENATSKPLTLIKSVPAILVYTFGLPVFFILGHHIFMRFLVKDCDHIGAVLAFLGIDLVKEKYITG